MLRRIIGLFLVLGAAAAPAGPVFACQRAPGIRVTCAGVLRHGVVAIGGETTGTTITFDRMTWELKLRDDASRTFATQHHKQPVVVVGSLQQVAGTETAVRWIVNVERITERDADTQKEGAAITVTGNLKALDDAAGKPRQMTVETESIHWLLDLTEDATFPARARSFVGKTVVVSGRIERVDGPRGPLRMMIRVLKIDAPTRQD